MSVFYHIVKASVDHFVREKSLAGKQLRIYKLPDHDQSGKLTVYCWKLCNKANDDATHGESTLSRKLQ